MKKKLISLILSGTVVSTTLIGVIAYSNYEKPASPDKTLEEQSKIMDKKNSEVEDYSLSQTEKVEENQNISQDKQVQASSDPVETVKYTSSKKTDATTSKNPVKKEDAQTTKKMESSNSTVSESNKSNKPSSGTQSKPSTPSNPSTSPKPSTPSTNDADFVAQVEQMIFNKVNEERSKAGVTPLTYNSTMEKYARIKSKDMSVRNYFDHKNPEGQLITAQMQQDGVSYRAWGENIAYIQGISDLNALANQFMTNWMNSPGHKQNILSTNFTSIGIGVYKSGNTFHATQEFYK